MPRYIGRPYWIVRGVVYFDFRSALQAAETE